MRKRKPSSAKDELPYFQAAADEAKQAKCLGSHCGAVIVKDDVIIGRGYNGPPLDLESSRTCSTEKDHSKRPKYDKTCCVHAEWRAILEACKQHGEKVKGSTLYFMRIDDSGDFTDAGDPYCTVCSRLALEAGLAEFALWNNGQSKIYSTDEYNALSYSYYKPTLPR